MNLNSDRPCTAFAGSERVASGHLSFVASKIKALYDAGDQRNVLIIDNHSSEVIEVDYRGSQADVAKQFTPAPELHAGESLRNTSARGRPKLGVVAKEITLLPRHWQWLQRQGKSPSVTLRKLVELASRESQKEDTICAAQNAVYRFMTTFAGHLTEYEEALRALYQRDGEKFQLLVQDWPQDLLAHLKKIAPPAFS